MTAETTPRTRTMPADTLRALPQSRSYVCNDEGSPNWVLLARAEGSDREFFAVSDRTGMLLQVWVTSRDVRRDKVRLRLVPAVDTGDAAGTLSFDVEEGASFPGFTWSAALRNVTRTV